MTLSPTISASIAGIPLAPTALSRLLIGVDERTSKRTILMALSGDQDASATFLRLAHRFLPGRRFSDVGEAVPLLGESISTRLALLATGGNWLRAIVGGGSVIGPLLRHSVACAMAAEPLGRESGLVDPMHSLVLGLLHHLGDAVRLSARRRRSVKIEHEERYQIARELLSSAGAPDSIANGLLDYGRFMVDPAHVIPTETQLLAAADHAVTTFGYAVPSPCSLPAVNGRVLDMVAGLFESRRRITRSIEEVVGCVVEPEQKPAPAAPAPDPHHMSHSPVVLADVLDGVSSRDLGPMPVLLSRITDAQDTESVAVAGTAGLVEELGARRAYFLSLGEEGVLQGGVLSSRGNVPLALHDLTIHRDQVPRAMNMALMTGRPILHEGLTGGLEVLAADQVLPTYFVPVSIGKEALGILGVEVTASDSVSPDLLAAVAAHMALALKAVDLRRLSNEAKTDELTGLLNRRGILDVLNSCVENREKGNDLAIALIDCDHLKKVNDNFGHLMGDEFLRRISEVVRQSLRGSDELGRYGGDEFLAVLPDAGEEHTRKAMERARANVEQAGLESDDGLLLSISIGAV
ncbi:MAG: diguanylate cyclase, partial [Planctomycetota bacterium]